jgi:hypothetical protein
VQITADARAALQNHEAKLTHLVGSLRTEGRDVYRALQATMLLAVAQDDVVHFESAFRKKLEESIVGGIELERIASGQWQCTHRGEEFVVSIRTEVLGASPTEALEFLSELKCQARTVRSMLLGDNAQWMRKLSKGCDKREFLNTCRCAPGERGNAARLQRAGLDWDDDMCHFCKKPQSSALLAGKHKCHVTAMFRCPECYGQWSSVQARFDPEEERVLGQKCKDCKQSGKVLRYNFSDVPEGGEHEVERKPHRSDLCEACGSYGNCQGAFFEPFIMSSAIALLTKQCGTQWARSGDILVANAGLHSVAMLPHISSRLDGQIPIAGDSSWGSMGSGKKKAGGDQGCFKSGKCGRMARDCPSGSGSKEGSGGKSKGKGKKANYKGRQVCHQWQAGNCSFGERCHFSHE